MSNCEGCVVSVKWQQEEMLNAVARARRFSDANRCTTAIYLEGYEFRFMEVNKAIELGYLPVDIVPFKA